MNKKAVIISGSPRIGGNSDTLCDQFMKGAQEAGHSLEKVYLNDMKINFCFACETCQSNGGHCIHGDDVDKVLAKLVDADVIVFATPVYYYAMAGQMKTFIDRTFPRGQELRNKEFYLIMTAADDHKQAMERTLEEFRGFFACVPGAMEKGVVYGTGVLNRDDIKKSGAQAIAYQMGKEI